MFAKIEPFWSWHTPIAWTGFLIFVDGWIWRRRGESPLRNDRAEMVFLTLVSIPLWMIFEEYNKHTLGNWHYVGLPETLLIRYVGVWGVFHGAIAAELTSLIVFSIAALRAARRRFVALPHGVEA